MLGPICPVNCCRGTAFLPDPRLPPGWLENPTMEFLKESMYFDFGNGEFPISNFHVSFQVYSKRFGGSVLIKHTP